MGEIHNYDEGGGEKMKKEPKKLIKGGREQKFKHNGGGRMWSKIKG